MNKFKHLIAVMFGQKMPLKNGFSLKEQEDIFLSLATNLKNTPNLIEMLENGFLPTTKVVAVMAHAFNKHIFININISSKIKNELSEQLNSLSSLLVKGMMLAQNKGEKYNFNPSYLFHSTTHRETYQFLFLCANPPSLDSCSPKDKISFINSIENYKLEYSTTSIFNSIVEELEQLSIEYKNFLDKDLISLNNQLKKENFDNATSSQIKEIVSKSNMSQTELGKKCALLQSKILDIQTNYKSELNIEDNVFLKSVLEEHIPRLLSTNSLMPKEISAEFLSSTHQTLESSLSNLLAKYEGLVVGLEQKYIKASAQNTTHSIESESLYLDAKRKSLGIIDASSAHELKTMNAKK